MADENKYNIKIEAGTDFVLPFLWTDDNDNPYDLTGSTVTAQLREHSGDPDAFDFYCMHNGVGGRITLAMPNEVTKEIPFSYGVYDVRVTLSSGVVKEPLYGDVRIQDEVTKPFDGTALYPVGISKYENLPTIGITNRLYFVYEDRKIYRWNGTNYISTAVGNGIQRIDYLDGGTYRMVFDDGTYFDFESVPRLMGMHDSTQAYQKLDIVMADNGASYIALIPVPANTAITSTTYWMQITPKTPTVDAEDVSYDYAQSHTDLVTNTGTADAPHLHFKVPRGVTGNESIDDDAGEGDDDVVWSADKSWKLRHLFKGYAKDYVTTTLLSEVPENGFYRVLASHIEDGLITDTPDGFAGIILSLSVNGVRIEQYYHSYNNRLYARNITESVGDWYLVSEDHILENNSKNILNHIYNKASTITVTLSSGGIKDNGTNLTSDKCVKSSYTSFSKPLLIDLNSNDYLMHIWTYGSQSQSDGIYTPTISYADVKTTVLVPCTDATKYFRISFRKKDYADMTDTDKADILSKLTISAVDDYVNVYKGMARNFVTTTLMSEIIENGCFRIQSSDISNSLITDAPDGSGGMLFNTYFTSRYYQIYFSLTENIYHRQVVNGTEEWVLFGPGNIDSIPYYWAMHLDSKIATIQSHEDVINGDEFIFITDYHYTGNLHRSPSLIRYLQSKTGAHFVVCGGDLDYNITNVSKFKLRMREVKELFSNVKNMKFVVGNHEWNNQANDKPEQQLTKAEVYNTIIRDHEDMPNIMIGDNLDYYFDNPSRKIRYFCLSCNHAANFNAGWQPREFLQNLANMPVDYDFVVIAHAMINRTTLDYLSTFKNIADGCDAYNAHTTHTYSGTTYDYSGKTGKCIIILCGHGHADVNTTTDGGIPIVMTTCDRMPDIPTGEDNDGRTRTQGTDTEQAFDVVQIDRDAGKVYMTRIGCGSNREFSF